MNSYARSPVPLDENSFAQARNAMVSTSHPLATETALDMLRRGGSAADAYVAAAAVQVVVEPPMTTFGGALGMSWFDGAGGKTTVVGSFFAKPEAEDGNWTEAGADTGRAAAVPGWLNGARMAWKTFGKLKWAELFEHALQYAEGGFVIDPHLWGWIWEYRHKMARFEEGQKLWYPQGHLVNPGDRLVQATLARTIKHIQSDDTLEWFYKGEFARRYVARIQADGGRLTMGDMAGHCGVAIRLDAPPIANYRGYEIHSPGGFALATALEAAEHGDMRRLGPPTENPENLYLQMRLIEEIWHEGLAYREAELLKHHEAEGKADPDYDVTAKAHDIWQRVMDKPSRPFDPMHPGTNALIVADRDGNVAFGTHSCSCHPFGNGHIVDGVWVSRPVFLYGQPAPIPAGIPTSLLLSKNGQAHFACGSPGVSSVNNIFQNTMNVIEFQMSPEDSVRQPMFGAPWHPSQRSMIEGNFPEDTYRHLTQRGMGFKRMSPNECEMGSCHAVLFDRDAGVIRGVADPRRRGKAGGL